MRFETLHPADQLSAIMCRIYEQNLTTTSGGNLSLLDADGNIWITPKGVDKGRLCREDILCVGPDGSYTGPHHPSSELPFHRAIYQARPDVRAIIHAHPPNAVAFSITHTLPNMQLLPALAQSVGKLALAAYATPGSMALGESIALEFKQGANAVILENHGVCVGGKDLLSAFTAFEALERCAEIEIIANRLGAASAPTPAQIAAAPSPAILPAGLAAISLPGEETARRELLALAQRACTHGLFSAAQSACSLRLSQDVFLITPEGKDAACLDEAALVRVQNGMHEAGCAPARCVAFHEAVYRLHPDTGAIFQALPPYAMAFAVTDSSFNPRTIPESYLMLQEACRIPFGSLYADVEASAALFSPKVPGAFFSNECLVMTGHTPLEAYDRLEIVEVTARSIILSRDIGPIAHIGEAEIQALVAAMQFF